MIYERAQKAQLPALTALWQSCFGDSETEIYGFWSAVFDKIQVYQARDGKSIAAMLCVLPTDLTDEGGESRTCGYFYAVCTAPRYRRRGICAALMRYAEQHCGCAYAALVPATEQLFDFYEKQGYRTAFYHKSYRVCAEKGARITKASPEVYRSIRELQLYGDFLSYDEALLSCAGQLYRIETQDGVYCACAVREGQCLHIKELLPDAPCAAAALAAHLGCTEANVRTEGAQKPFGMLKDLRGAPLPTRAYLGLAFD